MIKLYNIVHTNCGTIMTVEKEVLDTDIKEIIKPETKEDYREYGDFACYKVYLYSDNEIHYGDKYQLNGEGWFKW